MVVWHSGSNPCMGYAFASCACVVLQLKHPIPSIPLASCGICRNTVVCFEAGSPASASFTAARQRGAGGRGAFRRTRECAAFPQRHPKGTHRQETGGKEQVHRTEHTRRIVDGEGSRFCCRFDRFYCSQVFLNLLLCFALLCFASLHVTEALHDKHSRNSRCG